MEETEPLIRNNNNININNDNINDKEEVIIESPPPVTTNMSVILFILVISQTLNTLFFVRLMKITHEFSWFFVTFPSNILFVICIYPIVKYRQHVGIIKEAEMQIPYSFYARLGFLDMCASLLQAIPAPYLSGTLQVILQQAIIPINMLVANKMLGTSYLKNHYYGVIVISIGLIILLFDKSDKDEAGVGGASHFLLIILLITSSIPAAFSNVIKEDGLKEHNIDEWLINLNVNIFQTVFAMASFPTIFLPYINGRKAGPLPPNQFTKYMKDGFNCMIGINPECQDVPTILTIYLIVNILYNIQLMISYKRTSSTASIIATMLGTSLSALVFSIQFLAGPATKKLQILHIISLVILLGGMFVYNYKAEKQVKKYRFEEIK